MDVTPLIEKNKNIINSYGGDQFNISGKLYYENIVVLPNRVIIWKVKTIEELSIEDIILIQDKLKDIEIFLIGCGLIHQNILNKLKKEIKNTSIHSQEEFSSILQNKTLNIETMTTGAACRTYNVLLAEGRKVAAALIKV